MELALMIISGILLILCIYLIVKSGQSMTLKEVHRDYVSRLDHESLNQEFLINRNRIETLLSENAGMQSTLEQLRIVVDDKKREMENWDKRVEERFKNITNEIVKSNADTFRADSSRHIQSLIQPFQKNLESLQDKLDKSHEYRIKEAENFKGELKRLGELSTQLSQEADNLTKALTINPKMRGSWGETLLETLLEKAGLEKGHHYTREQTGQVDHLDDDSKRVRADIIIHLPENRHLIIDSKVSLNAYYDYSSCTDEEQPRYLKVHVANIRKHIDDLHGKRYDKMYEINSPELVFMFCPLEGGLITALQHDVELYEYAINKNVVLVTNSTLFATLTVVGQLWQRDKQYKNAENIAQEADKLHHQVQRFLGDMDKIDKSIKSAQDTYDSAYKRLSTGNNNVLRITTRIAEMGGTNNNDLTKRLN